MTTRQALEARICELCDEATDLMTAFTRTAHALNALRAQTRGRQLTTGERATRESYRAQKLDTANRAAAISKEIARLSDQLAELDGRTVGRSANRGVFEDIDLS